MTRPFAVFALCLAGAAALSADPTGTWAGQVKTDLSKVPTEQRVQARARLDSVKVTLDLKRDDTFTSTSTTGTSGSGAQSATGTWSQSGNVLTLKTKTRNGRPAATGFDQQVVVSKDGKTLVLTMNAGTRSASRVARKAADGPVVKVVFSRSK